MNILYVGGPLDGQRRPLAPGTGQCFKCYTRDGESNNSVKTGPIEFGIKDHIYFMQAVGQHRVMLYQSLSLFEALIKGYHRHRKPTRQVRQKSWVRFGPGAHGVGS